MSAGTEMRTHAREIAKRSYLEIHYHNTIVEIYRMFFDLSKKILKVTLSLFHQTTKPLRYGWSQ